MRKIPDSDIDRDRADPAQYRCGGTLQRGHVSLLEPIALTIKR